MAPDPRPIEPIPSAGEPTAEPIQAALPNQAAVEPVAEPVAVEPVAEPVAEAAEQGAEPVAGPPTTKPVTGTTSDVRFDDPDLIVAMRGVSRRFEDRVVLSGVDLAVPRGTILGIIGPSGAGKTTAIRMLTGALAPTSGDVSVMGRDPRTFRRSDRERIGYMPQQFTLYDDLTAGENIDFVASLFGMLWRRRRRRVREVLHIVDLWDARGRQAGRLSGGMQRRLELACALVHEPELIIL
ncbi:MAG: ATP-binding cassette domain-containing protein, partial [Chloroflexota bacterium]|nr:ATP-binding cassette domain-containing protein [Chloroflexota bacterium]